MKYMIHGDDGVLLRIEVADKEPPVGRGEFVHPMTAEDMALAASAGVNQRLRIKNKVVIAFDPRPTEQVTSDAAKAVDEKRNHLLADTDWMVVRSLEKGASLPAPWATYRQALRDITAQPGYPLNIEWPQRPEGA